jgi:hypothetical protein
MKSIRYPLAVLSVALVSASPVGAATASPAHLSHYRQFRASMPESGQIAHYAPAYHSRYDLGVSAPSQVEPFSGRGIFQDENTDP